MLSSLVLAGIVAGSASAAALPTSTTRYDGHVVVEAYPRSPDELETWLSLTDDVWSEHLSRAVVMRITPDDLPALRHSNLSYRVLHPDLQVAIDDEARRIGQARARARDEAAAFAPTEITEYLPLDDFRAFVDGWIEQHPELTRVETFGSSVEGRPIRAVHVSGSGGDDKPVLMLLGGHHAREWLAHHATLCAVDRLIGGYGVDDEATYWLDRVELIYIPMGNPDGYVYTWTNNRLWRKNRGAGGQGVDLNRNWDAEWGTASSNDPSSLVYHGPGPFSEPETAAFSELITEHRARIQGFVDVHAFGSIILYPYGYTADVTDVDAEYREVTDAMADAMDGAYLPVKITDFVGGLASGSSVDWVHDNIDDGLALGMEVRGIMFTEPATQITPTCDEIYPAFITLLESFETVDPEPDPDPDPDPDPSTGTSSGSGPSPGDSEGSGAGTAADDTTGTPPSATDETGDSDDPPPPATTRGSETTALPMGTSGPSQDGDAGDQGCACRVDAGGTGSSPWALWMLGLLGVRPRRRR